ncbi:hypothetical protein HDU67_008119 [Dinochytrium kinnereticum]|nr:hypothetical protein HDU67_008119 [Dinochytrium kinnereticum]
MHLIPSSVNPNRVGIPDPPHYASYRNPYHNHYHTYQHPYPDYPYPQHPPASRTPYRHPPGPLQPPGPPRYDYTYPGFYGSYYPPHPPDPVDAFHREPPASRGVLNDPHPDSTMPAVSGGQSSTAPTRARRVSESNSRAGNRKRSASPEKVDETPSAQVMNAGEEIAHSNGEGVPVTGKRKRGRPRGSRKVGVVEEREMEPTGGRGDPGGDSGRMRREALVSEKKKGSGKEDVIATVESAEESVQAVEKSLRGTGALESLDSIIAKYQVLSKDIADARDLADGTTFSGNLDAIFGTATELSNALNDFRRKYFEPACGLIYAKLKRNGDEKTRLFSPRPVDSGNGGSLDTLEALQETSLHPTPSTDEVDGHSETPDQADQVSSRGVSTHEEDSVAVRVWGEAPLSLNDQQTWSEGVAGSSTWSSKVADVRITFGGGEGSQNSQGSDASPTDHEETPTKSKMALRRSVTGERSPTVVVAGDGLGNEINVARRDESNGVEEGAVIGLLRVSDAAALHTLSEDGKASDGMLHPHTHVEDNGNGP